MALIICFTIFLFFQTLPKTFFRLRKLVCNFSVPDTPASFNYIFFRYFIRLFDDGPPVFLLFPPPDLCPGSLETIPSKLLFDCWSFLRLAICIFLFPPFQHLGPEFSNGFALRNPSLCPSNGESFSWVFNSLSLFQPNTPPS